MSLDWTTTLVTAAEDQPVSLPEAKAHLRISDSITDEHSYIDTLVVAATRIVEKYTGRALITQTHDLFLSDFPGTDNIRVPMPELQSVTTLKYKDTDGTQSTWAGSNYIVETDGLIGRVVLAYGKSWPTDTLYPSLPIAVRFVAGYGDEPGDVPEPLHQAILIQVAELYENREASVIGTIHKLTKAVERLCDNYRVWYTGPEV